MLHISSQSSNERKWNILLEDYHVNLEHEVVIVKRYFVFIICRLRDTRIWFHENNQFLDFSGRMGYKMKSDENVGVQVNYAVQR